MFFWMTGVFIMSSACRARREGAGELYAVRLPLSHERQDAGVREQPVPAAQRCDLGVPEKADDRQVAEGGGDEGRVDPGHAIERRAARRAVEIEAEARRSRGGGAEPPQHLLQVFPR